MPFESKAQSRFMFAKHPEMAKEWSAQTDYKDLPEKVKPTKKPRKMNKNQLINHIKEMKVDKP